MEEVKPRLLISLLFLVFFLLLVSKAKAANPKINQVEVKPELVRIGNNVTIKANVTDPDNDLKTVNLSIISPVEEEFSMFNLTNKSSLWAINYTPEETEPYNFTIVATDETGNTTQSDFHQFMVTSRLVFNISARVLPICGTSFANYYDPGKVLRGNKIVFFQLNSNNANVQEYEKSKMYVENLSSSDIVWGPETDEEVLLDLREADFVWGTWQTQDTTPLGTYLWHGISNYHTNVYLENETYNFTKLNSTANCTEIKNNHTYCIYNKREKCYDAYGVTYAFNTTVTSSKTVSGQVNGTTAYHGMNDILGTPYHAYTFKMKGCNQYCYACLTNDTNIDQNKECNYEGKVLNKSYQGYNYTPRRIKNDGRKVNFSRTFTSCTNMYINSSCFVNESNTAKCNESFYCNGKLEIANDFSLVNQTIKKKNVTRNVTVRKNITIPRNVTVPKPRKGPIMINIKPWNRSHKTKQGQWEPVIIQAENIGNRTATNITISPEMGKNWDVQNNTIGKLTPGEIVNRTVFIKPNYKVTPSTYMIPTRARNQKGSSLDLTYFKLKVLRAVGLAKFEIVEIPPTITLPSKAKKTFPVLIRNTGKQNLTGIETRIENIKKCLASYEANETNLGIGEEKSLNVLLESRQGPKTCRATIILQSEEGAVAFARFKIKVKGPKPSPRPGIKIPIMTVITGVTMAIFAALIILSRITRSKKRSEALEKATNIMFILSIGLLSYLVLWYLGYVPLI